MLSRKSVILFLLECLVLCSLAEKSFALLESSDEPIHITANATLFNYKTGVNTYEGDVKVDQGNTHLTADRLVTHNNEKHKLVLATAYGLTRPAEYHTLPSTSTIPLHAKADVIELTPETSTATLTGHVNVQQGKNSFKGPLMIYHIKDQIVDAPASKTGRMTLIINPKQQS